MKGRHVQFLSDNMAAFFCACMLATSSPNVFRYLYDTFISAHPISPQTPLFPSVVLPQEKKGVQGTLC